MHVQGSRSFHSLTYRPKRSHKCLIEEMSCISLVFRENSLIPMPSSIHLQCVLVQFSLTRLCKQLKEHQRMGDVSTDAHPSVVFELFLHKSEFPWHFLPSQLFFLLRNRLRLEDVTLSMSSLLVVLRDLSAWFSIFDTAHLTDLGSKTGYHRLTSFRFLSNNLLIYHAGS